MSDVIRESTLASLSTCFQLSITRFVVLYIVAKRLLRIQQKHFLYKYYDHSQDNQNHTRHFLQPDEKTLENSHLRGPCGQKRRFPSYCSGICWLTIKLEIKWEGLIIKISAGNSKFLFDISNRSKLFKVRSAGLLLTTSSDFRTIVARDFLHHGRKVAFVFCKKLLSLFVIDA